METTPVIITYKHIEERHEKYWQVLVQEVAYRNDGSAYPSVIAIAENPSKAFLGHWARNEGYKSREVAKLDLTPLQTSLF